MFGQKKKIVQFTPRYWPSLGGVEKHVLEVNKELIKQGFEVVVVTTQHDKKLPLQEKSEGVTIYRISYQSIDNKKETWQWIRDNKEIFSSSIIHVHDVVWWLAPVLSTIYKNFYITFHGWEGQYPPLWKNKLQRYFFAKCAKKTIHVGTFIQQFYWDSPTAITYGGVTVPNSSEIDKKINSFKSKKFNCVFIGRLEKANEIPKYLQLVKELQKAGYVVSMKWVGDGSLRDECKKVGQVTGMVADPSSYLKDADIVFAASYLSILEAQVRGKVVCSFYSHPLKEAYITTYPGSEYMLVSDSPTEMAQKIITVCSNKNLFKSLKVTAAQFAKTQTWKKVAEMYVQLWKN